MTPLEQTGAWIVGAVLCFFVFGHEIDIGTRNDIAPKNEGSWLVLAAGGIGCLFCLGGAVLTIVRWLCG